MYCKECGKKFESRDNFCINCGTARQLPVITEQPHKNPSSQMQPQPISQPQPQPAAHEQQQQPDKQTYNAIQPDRRHHVGKVQTVKAKKMKKVITISAGLVLAVVAITFLLIFIISGKTDKELVGKWEWDSGSEIYFFCIYDDIEFLDDGSLIVYDCAFSGESGTWRIGMNNRLIITGNKENNSYNESVLEFEYEINGNKLQISDADGDTSVYTKAG